MTGLPTNFTLDLGSLAINSQDLSVVQPQSYRRFIDIGRLCKCAEQNKFSIRLLLLSNSAEWVY